MKVGVEAQDPGGEFAPGLQLEQRIADDINTGRLSSGTWLKQIDLELRYGTERNAVRAALSRLEKQRLVERIPNRGYRVAEFSTRQIEEVFYVRSILEITAAELIISSASDTDIDSATKKLQFASEEFEKSMADGQFAEQIAAARRFHLEFLALCPNRELTRLIVEMRDRIPAAVLRPWHSRSHMTKSIEQHFKMVEALRKRDLDGLKQVLGEHIPSSRSVRV